MANTLSPLQATDWLREASDNLAHYCQMADSQFATQARLLDFRHVAQSGVIRVDFPSDASGEAPHAQAAAAAKTLWRLLDSMPQLDTPLRTERRREREKIRLQMQLKLALWLSFYCIGAPQLLLWEDIASLATTLGAFPGEGFFHKLVGDAYRAERVSRGRRRSRWLYSSSKPRQYMAAYRGLHVMAFAPIVLIPDDDGDDIIAGIGPRDRHSFGEADAFGWLCELDRTTDKDLEECQREYVRFAALTARLAYRYLRFQVWLYLKIDDGEELPLHYAVSQAAASAALENVADKRYAQSGRGELRTDMRSTDSWKAIFERVKLESDARARLFFGEPETDSRASQAHLKQRRLVVFKHKPDRRRDRQRGLTSAALGREHGVVASRPYRSGEWQDCCFYISGLPLAVEREKLKQLWSEYDGVDPDSETTHRSADAIEGFEFDENTSLGFAEKWYDPSTFGEDGAGHTT